MTRTLLLIFAFIALMIGSFIWFVATWDASKEAPIGFIWPEKLPPEGRAASNALPAIQPYENHTQTIRKPYGVS